jgi:WD40 repeat protein
MTLEGHKNSVVACAFSPDGRRIVSGSRDNTLRLWDAETGKELMTLEGHKNPVDACAFSPDGSRIVSGSWNNTLQLWDAQTGHALRSTVLFPGGAWAVFGENPKRLQFATENAWRWLGWLAPDPETGALTRYPAEIFGPLPAPPADSTAADSKQYTETLMDS